METKTTLMAFDFKRNNDGFCIGLYLFSKTAKFRFYSKKKLLSKIEQQENTIKAVQLENYQLSIEKDKYKTGYYWAEKGRILKKKPQNRTPKENVILNEAGKILAGKQH